MTVQHGIRPRLAALALCLLGLAGCGGAPQQAADIGQDGALEAAYAQASVSAEDVSWSKVSFDLERGKKIYEVEFTAGNLEYECEVDAATGEVVKYEMEDGVPAAGKPDPDAASPAPVQPPAQEEPAPSSPAPAAVPDTPAPVQAPAQEPAYIGEEAAKTAALAHAGLQAGDVDSISAWVDYDDGRAKCYDVEFWAGTAEYDYEIDLYSGAVLAHEMEHHAGDHGGHADGAAAAGDIGSEAALEAALAHAGLTASQVTEVEVSYDADGGGARYEVEFKCWPNEYEYEISASNGEVLKYEVDD